MKPLQKAVFTPPQPASAKKPAARPFDVIYRQVEGFNEAQIAQAIQIAIAERVTINRENITSLCMHHYPKAGQPETREGQQEATISPSALEERLEPACAARPAEKVLPRQAKQAEGKSVLARCTRLALHAYREERQREAEYAQFRAFLRLHPHIGTLPSANRYETPCGEAGRK